MKTHKVLSWSYYMRFVAFPLLSALLISGCSNAAEETVRQSLIDPASAEFREVSKCPANSMITKGEVNGKNRMGAFTGFEFFFVEGKSVYFASTPGVMEVMERCYESTDAVENDTLEDDPIKEEKGAWSATEKRDPIDDSAVLTATLDAETGRSRMGDAISLVARCSSNKTEMYVVWNDYVGDDSSSPYYEYKNVTIRVGEASAKTEQWDVSTDKQATFVRGAVPLLKSMVSEDSMVLRMTPYGENPITAVFDLNGIRQAIEPLAKECNWEL